MEKTFVFTDKLDPASIGVGHQVLGITHTGKYVLGKTWLNPSINKIQCSNMDYAMKYAVLD